MSARSFELNESKKRFFHHQSVSAPISVPYNGIYHGEVPFGPPVIHADPEKTAHLFPAPPPSNPELFTDNTMFFKVNGRTLTVGIVNPDGEEMILENDIEMKEEEEEE